MNWVLAGKTSTSGLELGIQIFLLAGLPAISRRLKEISSTTKRTILQQDDWVFMFRIFFFFFPFFPYIIEVLKSLSLGYLEHLKMVTKNCHLKRPPKKLNAGLRCFCVILWTFGHNNFHFVLCVVRSTADLLL